MLSVPDAEPQDKSDNAESMSPPAPAEEPPKKKKRSSGSSVAKGEQVHC